MKSSVRHKRTICRDDFPVLVKINVVSDHLLGNVSGFCTRALVEPLSLCWIVQYQCARITADEVVRAVETRSTQG